MRPPPKVYLDTSFFIGLLENKLGRQADCKAVVRWERSQNSMIFTSFLTLDEFLVKHYDTNRGLPDCDLKADENISQIREIANTYGLNDDVTKESARLQSVWGAFRMLQQPPLPRDRKFRWDAIHIATASVLEADRVYAFDGPWNDFPKHEIPKIGEIISPAKLPDNLFTLLERTGSIEQNETMAEPETEAVEPKAEVSPAAPVEAVKTDQPIVVSSLEGYTVVTDGAKIEAPEKPKATDEGGPSESGPKT
jgi:predicted nucleic acid-binding protein